MPFAQFSAGHQLTLRDYAVYAACLFFFICLSMDGAIARLLTLPYFTSGVDRLLHLPSAEAVSVWPNARPRM